MILVTGATGFLGRHVVAALATLGESPVRCLAHRATMLQVLKPYPVEVVQGDVRDLASLQAAVRGIDTIVHLVAVIRERGKATTFDKVNYQGTLNVLEAAKAARVGHLVFVSTIGIQEDPRLRYLYSRWRAEQAVLASDLTHTILRFSILFGPGDEFVNMLAGLVRVFPIVPVAGNGKNRFQPVAIDEAARCIALVAREPRYHGQVMEIGGPEHLTYDQIMDVIAQTYGVRRLKLHIPASLMRPLVAIMELLLPRPPVTLEQLKLLHIDNVTDLDSVERTFGFRPRPLRGNIDYIKGTSLGDALRILLGSMPRHIRDH